MTVIQIDGSHHTGNYRVTCECHSIWTGQGEPIGRVNFSPALPVAEAVVHMKLAHAGELLHAQLSERFRGWLVHYWEREGLRRLDQGQQLAQLGPELVDHRG